MLAAACTPVAAQRTVPLVTHVVDGPKISADGRIVVYSDSGGIHIVHSDGSGSRKVANSGWSMSLSEDGGLLELGMIGSGNQFFARVLDTTTLSYVDIGTTLPYGAEWPVMSADGSTVGFEHGEWGLVYAADSDGSNYRQLDSRLCALDQPSITADGSSIVMDAIVCGLLDSEIYRFPGDGSGAIQLTRNTGWLLLRPRVSADGGKITYENYSGPLLVMDGDGSNVIQLSPPWNLVSYSGEGRDHSAVSGDGGIAVFDGTGGPYVVRTDGTGLRQIGTSIGARQVAIDHRGDVVVHQTYSNGTHGLAASGVPGVSPGEIKMLRFDVDTETLTWDDTPASNAHNLYRIDASALSAGNTGPCLQGGIPGATTVDADVPPPGGIFAYDVAGENSAGEGTLGLTSAGIERAAAVSCPPGDYDGDGTPDIDDTCPLDADPLQADQDGDGLGDVCDNCPEWWNPNQRDSNADGVGNVCDCLLVNNPGGVDTDGDQLVDSCDTCPSTYNPDQEYSIAPVATVTSPAGGAITIGTVETITWTATDVCGGVGLVDLYLSRDGLAGPYEPIAYGVANTGSYAWTVAGPKTQGPSGYIRVVAKDPAGNAGQDESDAGFRIN